MEKISTLMKKMNVLELIEMIIELTNDQGITTEIKNGRQQLVSPAKPYIKELMKRLGLESEMEAMFLAVFVDQCNDSRINMKDIARHFDVRMVKIISMAEHIDGLVRKGIVLRRKDSDGDITYRVPNKTIECLRRDTLPDVEPIENLTPMDFYDRIDQLLCLRDNEEIEDDELYLRIDELIEKNSQLELAGSLRSFGLEHSELVLYLVFCRLYVNNHDDNIGRSDIRDYFASRMLRHHLPLLTGGCHPLMEKKLVEHAFEDGQADTEHWRLTDYSKREVLSELKLGIKKDNRSNLTRHEDITPKTLYYNERVTRQVEQLEGIMIATTNLTGSFDAAFERRFLYKIEFEKPTPAESCHIWKSMLPELTDDEALDLAQSYAFSGGQIENIARKQLIDNVLSERDGLCIEAIREACKSESLSKYKTQRVGF